MRGAEAWAKIASDNYKLEVAEEAKEEAVKSREELLELLTGKLTSGPAASILRNRIAGQIESETGIVDAEIVPEEESNGNGTS
jgi:hypothetical protein